MKRLISACILVLLLFAVFFACSDKGGDPITPEQLTNTNLVCAIAGGDTRLVVDLAELANKGKTTPWAESADGARLYEFEAIGTSNRSRNSYFIVDAPEEKRVLTCRESSFGADHVYTYTLYGTENGRLTQLEQRSAELIVSADQPAQPNDNEAVLAFFSDFNALLERSTLLLSTDKQFVMGSLTRSGAPLELADTQKAVVCGNVGGEIREKPGFAFFGEGDAVSCRAELTLIDKEFEGAEDYDPAASTEEKLEYLNRVLAVNRAKYAACAAAKSDDFENCEIVLSRATDEGWSFTVRVADCPKDDGTRADMIVFVENDGVTGVIEDRSQEAGKRVIYLTFDDGPCENTYRVLDLLDRYGAKATFFTVGYFVDRHPEIAAEIMNRGQLIACHTYSHEFSQCYASANAFINEVHHWEEAVRNACSRLPDRVCVRFPGGSATASAKPVKERICQLLRAGGYRWFDWNAGNNDKWPVGNTRHLPNREYLYQSYLESMDWFEDKPDPSVIFLSHDTEDDTVANLERVLKDLIARGYEFRTLDEHPDWYR